MSGLNEHYKEALNPLIHAPDGRTWKEKFECAQSKLDVMVQADPRQLWNVATFEAIQQRDEAQLSVQVLREALEKCDANLLHEQNDGGTQSLTKQDDCDKTCIACVIESALSTTPSPTQFVPRKVADELAIAIHGARKCHMHSWDMSSCGCGIIFEVALAAYNLATKDGGK